MKLSFHGADQAELQAWHAHTGAGRTFLVHDEVDTMRAFAERLPGTKVEMPELHQAFTL